MRDRNDGLNSERGTTSSNPRADEVPQLDASCTQGPWAGQHPTIVQTTSPIGHDDADANHADPTSLAPNPNSHLARLVEAVQKSRRLGAAPRRRHYLRLVQNERP